MLRCFSLPSMDCNGVCGYYPVQFSTSSTEQFFGEIPEQNRQENRIGRSSRWTRIELTAYLKKHLFELQLFLL